MGDSGGGWWFGADRRWRKGSPPRGWLRGEDGSWHPPSDDLSSDEPDDLTWVDAPEDGSGRHVAAEPERSGDAGYRDSSFWTRIAAPVSVVVVAVCAIVAIGAVAGIATMETGEPGGRADDVASLENAPESPAPAGLPETTAGPTSAPPAAPAESSSTSTSPSSSTTSSSTSTTTSTTEPPSTETTAEPARTGPLDPFALCSEAQRAIGDRGNRPWSWYLTRLDQDGDGILCN